jgi:hypothetical protein
MREEVGGESGKWKEEEEEQSRPIGADFYIVLNNIRYW